MLISPSMNHEVQDYIRTKLNELEQINQIKIIHAIESSSRAWGFPSIDSDYKADVLFHKILAYDLDQLIYL